MLTTPQRKELVRAYKSGLSVSTLAQRYSIHRQTAVAVNTVNASTNSSYYIANDGTKPTSMDGYTVPLQCNVPVTPGVPVTVQVAVADTSDGIYDSAVGLLEKGIWSD